MNCSRKAVLRGVYELMLRMYSIDFAANLLFVAPWC